VKPATVASKAAVLDEEDEAPVLMNPDLPTLEAVIEKSDVVIEILDARDPLAYRSSHLEELVKSKTEKKLLLVLNKIGTLFAVYYEALVFKPTF
jgi:nuclear GTP-binding protein